MIEIFQEYGLHLLIGQYPNGPLGGLAMTLLLALCSVVLSFPLALLIALGRVGEIRWISSFCKVLVNVVRGMPALMLVFWMYFMVPKLLGTSVSGFWLLVSAIVLYIGAYMSEDIRGAICALPKGQFEAARSLGCGYWRTMFQIVLPQALVNALPSLTNQCVNAIKETSLGYILGVNELTFSANQVNTMMMTRPFEVFGILAGMYFIMCFSLSRVIASMEVRIHRTRNAVE